MIDPLIKILKKRMGDHVVILYYMDDLKASVSIIEMAQNVPLMVKRYAASVGMAINKKRAIQPINEITLPSLSRTFQDWTRPRTSTLDLK